MGLVFKSLLAIILIFLFFALIELTSSTGLITNFLTEETEKLFYDFNLEKSYETKVSIVELKNVSNIFLGITSDNLEFGIIPSGSVSKRFLNLGNKNEIDHKIALIATGNISPMIKFDKNNFILHKNENTTITVSLDSSFALNPGNYTGEVSVISKKSKFSFLNSFMEDS